MKKVAKEEMKVFLGYTPSQKEAFEKGVLYGAKHHKELNRLSDEWYKRHEEAKRRGEEQSDSVCEFFKEITGLGKAVENMSHMRTYEEVRDEVLEKFIRALSNDEKGRKEFMRMLVVMDEQDRMLKRIEK